MAKGAQHSPEGTVLLFPLKYIGIKYITHIYRIYNIISYQYEKDETDKILLPSALTRSLSPVLCNQLHVEERERDRETSSYYNEILIVLFGALLPHRKTWRERGR
jgi:hypothetical protein